MRKRFISYLAGAFACLLVSAGTTTAATVIGGSDLLTGSKLALMESWLVGDSSLSYSGSLTFTNIFDKSEGDTSYDFHAAANGMGPTVFVAEMWPTAGGDPHLIGGFNPQNWRSGGSANITSALADRTAFLFDLTTISRYDQIEVSPGQYQTFNHGGYGPSFGYGYDISVNTALSGGYLYPNSYCPDTAVACKNTGVNFLGGSGYLGITIGRLEVFTISEISPVPLPAALPLFLAALSGLGFFGWRRKRRAGGGVIPAQA